MATKVERLDLRMTEAEKDLIVAAAELRGTTVAGFALATLIGQARVDIARREGVTLALDEAAWSEFSAALDKPEVADGMRDLLTTPGMFDAV